MKNDNINKNYPMITDDDITEIKNVLEYASGLIIKNQIIADSYETIESLKNSTIYIQAVKDLKEKYSIINEVTVKNYEELNSYYITLNKNFGISYYDARIAEDFQIIIALHETLSQDNEELFKECYKDVLKYYKAVFATKAFNNQTYNREYFQILLMAMTINRYFTKKMELYYNVDKYTKKQLKNSFISLGFDYFDGISINYQKRILKLLNELIISKGTNIDIEKILDIFGYKNIDIYKYTLVKEYPTNDDGSIDYNNPYMLFYKSKTLDNIDFEKDIALTYDSVVKDDPFWRAKKEDVMAQNFNAVTSKYMSVDLTMDSLTKSQELSYFYNLLYKFKNEYDKTNEKDFSFFNSEISSSKIDLFDSIIGLSALIFKYHKIELEIPSDNTLDKSIQIYGYNELNNNNTVLDILNEIKYLIVKNKDKLKDIDIYEELYEYFQIFNLHDFNNPLNYNTLESIYDYYDNNYNSIEQEMSSFGRYYENIALVNYMKDTNNDIIDRLNFLRIYLLYGKITCKEMIEYLDIITDLFKNYIVIEGYRNPESRIDINLIFENNEELINDIVNYVNVINDVEATEMLNNNDYISLCEVLINYNKEFEYEIRTKYNVKSESHFNYLTKNNERSIKNYKELYAFITLFYQEFYDIKNDDTYSVSNFMQIFNSNEKLREQLINFIAEVNDYHLYRKLLDLYNEKMLTNYDTSYFTNYKTFEDYIKSIDIEFYNWMIPDKDIENDSISRKNFFDEHIMTLIESIDTYINTQMFTGSMFSSVIDKIRETLYILVTIFKSYTIDLTKTNTVLNIDDKAFNAFRFFDEITGWSSEDVHYDRISLQDVFQKSSRDGLQERINFKDKVIITAYGDDE